MPYEVVASCIGDYHERRPSQSTPLTTPSWIQAVAAATHSHWQSAIVMVSALLSMPYAR